MNAYNATMNFYNQNKTSGAGSMHPRDPFKIYKEYRGLKYFRREERYEKRIRDEAK